MQTVIINGTKFYADGVMSDLMLLQMIGRAGRPQFASSGKESALAIIMTSLGNHVTQ